ncbi:MAG: group III truncated hemoglobin [Flavobacteriaceae bacterium]
MQDISSRNDIQTLVHTFYDRVRAQEVLGPIFNAMIPAEAWPVHLEKLIDFWETNLFGIPKFKGNPVAAHVKTDQFMSSEKGGSDPMDAKHFGIWLQLWMSTIDELFEGQKAQRAKDAARKMSVGQHVAVWRSRPENQG